MVTDPIKVPLSELVDGDMFWSGAKHKRLTRYDERGRLAGYNMASGHLSWFLPEVVVIQAQPHPHDPPVPRPRNWQG